MKGFFESLVIVKYPNFRLTGKNPLMGTKNDMLVNKQGEKRYSACRVAVS